MKRKLAVMTLSALACLTISSCDIIGGFLPTQGLTEKEARTFTQEAGKTTRQHLVNTANGEAYYLDFSVSADANYDVSTKITSTYNNKVDEERNYGNIAGSGSASVYLDLTNIKSDKLGTSYINASGNVNATTNYVLNGNQDTSYSNVTAQVVGDKSELTVNYKLDDGEEVKEKAAIDPDSEKEVADVIEEIVTAPSDQNLNLGLVTGVENQLISWNWYSEFETKTNQFKDKEITSKDYLDYVDEKFLGNVLENDLDQESYDLIVKVLDKYEAILPEYFFNFSKEEVNGSTVLHGEFNYNLWKLSLQAAVVEVAAEKVENLEELMADIEEMTTLYMPTKFVWTYDLTVDANGVISAYKLHLDVEGTYKLEEEWSYGDTTYVDTNEITYKANANLSFNFRVASTPKNSAN